ncbi:methyltransferase domain-containing protein, partial [Bradyrhizobium sp. PRIMUS42]
MIGVTSGMAQHPPTPPALFDRALLHARQRRAQMQGAVSFLLDRVAEDMAERLAAVMREFHTPVDLWTPGEGLATLRPRLPSIEHIALDAAGAEKLPFAPESLDLAVSALALQFVNDLPGVLAQVRRALKPDGLLLAAMIGGDSL